MEQWMVPLIAAGVGLLGGVVGTLIASLLTRRSSRETNEINRFSALFNAMDVRIQRLEGQVDELEKSDAEKTKRIATLGQALIRAETIVIAQARYIRKLLLVFASFMPELDKKLVEPDPADADLIEQGGASDITPPTV